MEIDAHPPELAAVEPSEAATIFAALGAEVRLEILRLLVRAGPDGLPVGAIQDRLSIAASTLSHHLRALANAGVLIQRRAGRILNCHADFDRLTALSHFLICECCVDAAPNAEREIA